MSITKKINILLACIALLFSLLVIQDTFAKYLTDAEGEADMNIARWKILVNNKDIRNNSDISETITPTFLENEHIAKNIIAPTSEGYFDIVIDPTDTDVSVRYDIGFDFSEFENTNITITSIQEINDKKIVKTGDNKYTGIITLDEISAGTTNTIRVNIAWENNEENNEHDSNLSSVPNTILNIPVTINVSQYLGETIE